MARLQNVLFAACIMSAVPVGLGVTSHAAESDGSRRAPRITRTSQTGPSIVQDHQGTAPSIRSIQPPAFAGNERAVFSAVQGRWQHLAALVDEGQDAQFPNEERAEEDRRAQADELAGAEFDRWIFGVDSTFQSQITPEIAQHRLETLLKQQIVFIDQTCGLTEDQANKLRLAGRADFKRFFDLVDEKRREYRAVKDDPVKLDQLHKAIRPL